MKRSLELLLLSSFLLLVTTPCFSQSVFLPSMTQPKKVVNPALKIASGSHGPVMPLVAYDTLLLANYDYDSSHKFGTYQLPDSIPVNHGQGNNDFERFSYSERFTMPAKGKWYFDSATVAFRAPNVVSDIKVYLVKPVQLQNGFLYPFFTGWTNMPNGTLKGRTQILDSAIISKDEITEPDSIHFYTVGFHSSKQLALVNGSVFVALSTDPFSGNIIDVLGDEINNGTDTRPIDTSIDRAMWTAIEVPDGRSEEHTSELQSPY